MTKLITIILTATLTLSIIIFGATLQNANASSLSRSRIIRHHGPCSGRMALIRKSDGPGVYVPRVKRLIRCAFSRWSGDVARGLCTAYRESHYFPWAHNPSGASGLFQHLSRYWPGRAREYLRDGWFPRMSRSSWTPSPFNARANVLVTARLVQAEGWSPWAGGCV